MGCFSYICPHCGMNIRESEKCVLIHLRHSKILGFTQGHYNSYGSVDEEDLNSRYGYRNDVGGENCQDEIWKSEFQLEDSFFRTCEKHIYNEKPLDRQEYFSTIALEALENKNYDLMQVKMFLKILNDKDYRENPQIDLVKNNFRNFENASTIEKREKYREYLRQSLSFLVKNHKYDSNYMGFESLDLYIPETYSGTIAYHLRCFTAITKRGPLSLIPSGNDPNQGCGNPRKNFS